MKKLSLFFLLFVAVQFHTLAQTYTFSQSTAPYTDLTSPTNLFGTVLWDDTSAIVPIGFPFMLGSLTFSNVEIGSNGVLLFNSGTSEAAIAGYDADFASLGTTASTSPIGYQLTGTTGSRIFKAQWKNTGFYDGTGADFANIQVWLYEGSNKIETHIGASSFANPLDIFGSGGPANGVATMIDFNTEILTGLFLQGSPSAATTLTLNNSHSYPFLNAPPVNGTVYTYAFLTSGVTKNLKNSSLVVYPNPVSEVFQIKGFSTEENVTIKIYDTVGNVVLTQENTGNLLNVNVAHLTKGTYFVEITAGKEHAGKKLIKL